MKHGRMRKTLAARHLAEYTYGPKQTAREYYGGRRFAMDREAHGNGAPVGTRHKFSRGRIRRALMRGNVDLQLAAYRRSVEQVKRLASNSHEARRYVAQAKREDAQMKRALKPL